MTIIISPGNVGKKPNVSFDPPNNYAVIDNRATTVKNKKEAAKTPLSIELKATANKRTKIIITGSTYTGGGATLRKRVDYPSMYAGYLMKQALKVVGIQVKGKVKRGEKTKGKLLARHTSYTLPYLVASMQKWSNNFMAEMLFKSLDLGDDPATWKGAQDRIARFLEKAGIKRGTYKVTNGSGLYNANEISAAQFTTVLSYLYNQRKDILPEFEASLAIAGSDGTLRKRMVNTPGEDIVRGKTGTLNHVVTLSGYVYTKTGKTLAYSILFNKTKGGAWGYRKIQDEIAARLALY